MGLIKEDLILSCKERELTLTNVRRHSVNCVGTMCKINAYEDEDTVGDVF